MLMRSRQAAEHGTHGWLLDGGGGGGAGRGQLAHWREEGRSVLLDSHDGHVAFDGVVVMAVVAQTETLANHLVSASHEDRSCIILRLLKTTET
jgi:hypothetical protein